LQKGCKLGKKKNNNKIIHFILGVLTLTLVGVFTIGVNSKCNDLNVEIHDLNRQLTYFRNEITNLDGRITHLNRSDYIVKIAKEKIDLVAAVIEPDEIVLND